MLKIEVLMLFFCLVHSDHGSRSPSHSPHSMSPTTHLVDTPLLPPITTASQQYHSVAPLSTVGSIPGIQHKPIILHVLHCFCFLIYSDIPVTSASCPVQQPISQCCYIDQVKTILFIQTKPFLFVGVSLGLRGIQFLL